ncbi:hypothetical protein [Streptomyces sp. NPDC059271]|uniref:hypothetical protein n=1 Tax=Streptomyces sp. NPDC059271 TaxID=3346799 RepID=UPI0036CCE404
MTKRRPAFGIPISVVLLATPEGWRHSVLTEDGVIGIGLRILLISGLTSRWLRARGKR